MADVKVNDVEAARAVFGRFAGMVREGTTIRTIDPGQDQAQVLPCLVPPELLREAEANNLRIPHRPFWETGLHITYVLDSEHSMAHITEQILAELGLTMETVHPLALANLRKRFKAEVVRGVFERNAMSVVKTGDGYQGTSAGNRRVVGGYDSRSCRSAVVSVSRPMSVKIVVQNSARSVLR